jgi:hypothetical protein
MKQYKKNLIVKQYGDWFMFDDNWINKNNLLVDEDNNEYVIEKIEIKSIVNTKSIGYGQYINYNNKHTLIKFINPLKLKINDFLFVKHKNY